MTLLNKFPGVEKLNERGWLRFLNTFLTNRVLINPNAVLVEGREDRGFAKVDELWNDILNRRGLLETARLELKGFTLTEWFPLAPGQFHTTDGLNSRSTAEQFVVSHPQEEKLYDPHGKGWMVRGGVGCLRVGIEEVGNKELKFLGATTRLPGDATAHVHAGFIVAMRPDLYSRVENHIDSRGGVVCDLVGRLRHWPVREKPLWERLIGIPRAYMLVEEASGIDPEPVAAGHANVTAAVTFKGTYNGQIGKFFTYSHFDPTIEETRKECVQWLRDVYVGQNHQGQVLTDFDGKGNDFPGVTHQVRLLMDPKSRKVVPWLIEWSAPEDWERMSAFEKLKACPAKILDELPVLLNIKAGDLPRQNESLVQRANALWEVVVSPGGPGADELEETLGVMLGC